MPWLRFDRGSALVARRKSPRAARTHRQMLATQPVVDASRPSFEVGEDLVDPRQDEVSGGSDDMDIVAIGVAGPAVGFRDGVGIGGGFDEVSEVGGASASRRRPGMFP